MNLRHSDQKEERNRKLKKKLKLATSAVYWDKIYLQCLVGIHYNLLIKDQRFGKENSHFMNALAEIYFPLIAQKQEIITWCRVLRGSNEASGCNKIGYTYAAMSAQYSK